LGEPLGQPIDHPGANEVHLVRPGGCQPEGISGSLGVAGGDQSVEGGFEDLGRHPDVVGDVTESGLTSGLAETVDLQKRP
jgi:hypothetical protein